MSIYFSLNILTTVFSDIDDDELSAVLKVMSETLLLFGFVF